MADKPSVLFVCVHNAGRSQMAAGYLTHLAGGAVEVRSAGSEPADQVNPVAVAGHGRGGHRHHRRAAQDPHHRRRQGLRRRDHHGLRRQPAPFFPGKRYEDWVLDDPAGQDLEHVRPSVIRSGDASKPFSTTCYPSEPASTSDGVVLHAQTASPRGW